MITTNRPAVLRLVRGWAVVALALGTGIVAATAEPARGVHAGESDPILIAVNGDPIYASDIRYPELILTGGSTYLMPESLSSPAEARAEALQGAIADTVLLQEAGRRGITVTTQARDDALAAYLSWVGEQPDLMAEYAHVRTVFGLSEAEHVALLSAWVEKMLALRQLQKELDDESPTPTQAQVNGYIASHALQPGDLKVVALMYDDVNVATMVYDTLAALQTSQPPTDFATTVIEAGVAGGALDKNAPVTAMAYSDASELPLYAQSAVAQDEGTLGIADNGGGQTAVYLVLAKAWTSQETIRQRVTEDMTIGMREAHSQSLQDTLVSNALITYYE